MAGHRSGNHVVGVDRWIKAYRRELRGHGFSIGVPVHVPEWVA